jgi:hypothetical protein
LDPERPVRLTLCLRIPGWVEGRPLPSDLYTYDNPTPAAWTLQINGEPLSVKPAGGFARITREWQSGDVVTLDLPMPVRRVSGHPQVEATRGQVALERGPVVYAFEGVDNDGSVFDIVLPAAAEVTAEHVPDLLGGITRLKVTGAQRAVRAADGEVAPQPASLAAIPYAAWANRGLSPMTVWVARALEGARVAPRKTIASRAEVSASFHRSGMEPARLNDQISPQTVPDGSAPNFDFWPRKGTAEWVAYEFAQPTPVRGVTVSWFDDTGSGECRLPLSWRVLYRAENGGWQPVTGAGDFPVRLAHPVRVSFDPVTTLGLRLDIQLPPDFSSGLYEWEVE